MHLQNVFYWSIKDCVVLNLGLVWQLSTQAGLGFGHGWLLSVRIIYVVARKSISCGNCISKKHNILWTVKMLTLYFVFCKGWKILFLWYTGKLYCPKKWKGQIDFWKWFFFHVKIAWKSLTNFSFCDAFDIICARKSDEVELWLTNKNF